MAGDGNVLIAAFQSTARASALGEKFLNIQTTAVRSESWFERRINKSSTYCSRVPFSRLSSLSSLVNTFQNNGGCPEYPAGVSMCIG